jgi:hypothetical protein
MIVVETRPCPIGGGSSISMGIFILKGWNRNEQAERRLVCIKLRRES